MTATWSRRRGGENSPRRAPAAAGRRRRPVRRALLTGAAVGALTALWLFFAPAPLGGSSNYVGTYGVSMEPRFHTGDLAIVRAQSSYRIGEVVAYHNRELGRVVLHRIIGRNGDRYVFKGDNNNFVDPDEPTRSELVGELWLRVPRGGVVLSWTRDPRHAAPVSGLVAALMLTLLGGSAAGRRRRRKSVSAPAPTTRPPLAAWAQPLVGPALIATVVCGLAVAVSYSRPTTQTIETAGYVQQGAYSYSARVQPSAVYPSGRLATSQTVFTKLVKEVEIGFFYRFLSALPHSVHGTARIRLTLTSGLGWTVPLPSPPVRAVSGDTAQLRQTLDLTAIEAEVARYLARTGVETDNFTLVVTPAVTVDGTVLGQPVHATFAPTPLSFVVDPTTLRLLQPTLGSGAPGEAPADPLHPSAAGTVARTTPATLRLLGHAPLVTTVRRFGLLGLVGAAALAALALLTTQLARRDATMRIHSRYGELLVCVPAPPPAPATGFLEVEGFADLARVAAYLERPVLCSREADVEAFYLVSDEATYRYSSNSSSEATITSAADRSSVRVTPFGTATQ